MLSVRIRLIAACIVLACGAAIYFTHRAAADNTSRAENLEAEIRSGLPLGSSLPVVEGFLAKRRVEFSFDEPSKSVRAVIRKLKGSTIVASKSLTLRFKFDEGLKLKSLDGKVVYTGP
jgi:hypothetical protein